MKKRILTASPRGFCFGVERGIKILEEAIKQEKGVVYVRNEIVHNVLLTERFKSRGVIFVEELDEVPDGGAVVFSAHGVAPAVREEALRKNLKVYDATCPLVTRVHEEAVKFKNQGYTIVLIGIPGHPEITGITGEAPDNIRFIRDERDFGALDDIDDKSGVAWLSQTTLNADAVSRTVEKLREKFPRLKDPSKSCVCHATKNRQAAVRKIAGECDLFIVVGSEKSSNTQRLKEAAVESGAKTAVRIDKPEELRGADFSSVYTVGIASGVSVSEDILESVVTYLNELGYGEEETKNINK